MLTDALNRLRTHPHPDQMRETLLDIANAFMERDEETVEIEERQLFGDFILTALDRLGDDIRSLVVDAVCDSALLSQEVAAHMASHESVTVALPVLESSPALSDEALVELAKTQPEERQIAIARRREVSEPVSDALIEHGTERVMIALSENDGVRFSPIGLARLLHQVGDNPLVQAGLSKRSSSQPGFDRAIFQAVDDTLRSKLGEFLDYIEGAAYSAIVREAASGVVQRAGGEMSSRLGRHALMKRVRAGNLAFDKAFAELLESDRMIDCIWALHQQTGLPEDLVSTNSARSESDRIAIICRAAGVSDESYTSFSRHRLRVLGQTEDGLNALRIEYAGISSAEARRAIRIVKWHTRSADNDDVALTG